MARRNWQISRRTLLRGAGAAIALPWLNAMERRTMGAEVAAIGPAAAAAAAGGPPLRTGFLYFPNGVWTDTWIPKAAGTEFELPFALSPLAPFKQDINVLSGLDKAASHEGDGHYAKTANFLTGAHVNKTAGKDISAGGISADQLIAEKQGGATPLSSLELSIDPVVSGIDSVVGYTRLYASYISWRGPGLPVAREIHPRAVYDRLFGAKDASGRPTAAAVGANEENQSLLDLALEDAQDLRSRVGRDDQSKIDEYLEAVRSVEKRVEFASRPDARTWKPPTSPSELVRPPESPRNYLEHVRLMLDMMVLAFWTDSTRVASFMFANDVSPRNFSALIDGVHGGHHEISHHQNDKAKIEQYQLINRWHVQQFAWMLEKMRGINEGDGTLLDHSQILFGSSFSDGNRHDPANLPIILAGRAGGSLPTGQHVANPQGTPLCNLYVSMLNRAGVETTHFGDSTGRLNGLEG